MLLNADNWEAFCPVPVPGIPYPDHDGTITHKSVRYDGTTGFASV